MGGVSSQELIDFLDVVLLGQLDGVVPLIELDADVDGVLDAVAFGVGGDGLLAHSHGQEHGRDFRKQNVILRQRSDHFLEALNE